MGATDQGVRDAVARQPGDVQAAINAGIDIGKQRADAKTPNYPHAKPYIILLDEKGAERVEFLSTVFEQPDQRTGKVRLDDGPSFIAYFNRYKVPGESAIYAKMSPLAFVGVLDDHQHREQVPGDRSMEKAATVATVDSGARFREFRAIFTPALSPEWTTWTGKDRKDFTGTTEFAYFLEDNFPDIAQPAGAELMELALNFRVNQQVSYRSAQRLQDGHVEFQYANIVTGGGEGQAGSQKMPEVFKITVPVFAGIDAPRYEVDARFRYKVKDGALFLRYELVRPHKVLEQAFQDLWRSIGEKTSTTILLGVPE